MATSKQSATIQTEQLKELLLQTLETELGGVEVYQTALRCVQDARLRKEWEEYLSQTERHIEVAQNLLEKLEIDSEEETPGRGIVRHIGLSLVSAMDMALAAGDLAAAELVAAECVTLAETKDHQNWSLIAALAKEANDEELAAALKDAAGEVEEEEAEHLYHTAGWSRELWLSSLGAKAILPPPEEKKDVKTAIAAARAKAGREG